jgi:outer membrane protein assembly factor BamB
MCCIVLKHLDKFYNKKDIPWVNMIWNTYYSHRQIPHATGDRGSLWWKDLLHLCDKFRGIATCTMGDGSTILFGLDVWNGHLLQNKLPRLFTFAKNQKIGVFYFLKEVDMT